VSEPDGEPRDAAPPAVAVGRITQVVELLRRAGAGRRGRLLFVTGAGLSADSGMPTYRGVGGLYETADTEDGVPIEEALSGAMLRRRPELSWKYLLQIARARRGRSFNRGHEVIALLERRFDVCTLTQNVDGFHRAAGSTDVIDIHGDLHDLSCTACDWRTRIDDDTALDEHAFGMPPACPACGAPLRPDVVLFGELLPVPKVERLQRELDRGFDVVLSVGTSSVFPYIVEPVLLAAAADRPTVEINPEQTPRRIEADRREPAGVATMATQPPDAVELDGLSLRRLVPDDAGDLLAHFADASVTEFLDFPALTRIDEARAIIEWADALVAAERGIRWAIRATDGAFLGTCGFNAIIRQHGSRGEIAYDLARRCWGRGLMGIVMPGLLDVGFRQLDLHRLEAFVTPGNERSVRVLERHGFRHEGRLRGYGHWRGAFQDQDLFAMLAPEWRPPRAGARRAEPDRRD
jgi:NAD-dependent deacetylase